MYLRFGTSASFLAIEWETCQRDRLRKKDLEGGRKGTEPRQRIWEAGKKVLWKKGKNAVSAARNLRCGTVDVEDK